MVCRTQVIMVWSKFRILRPKYPSICLYHNTRFRIFISTGYKAVKKKYCKWKSTNSGKSFTSFKDAEAYCNALPSCMSFYGEQDGTNWGTCPPDSTETVYATYTLYKKGNCQIYKMNFAYAIVSLKQN